MIDRLRKNTSRVFEASVLGLVLLLFAPGALAQTPGPTGGSLAYAETERVGDLNPYERLAARGPSDRLYSLIFDPLVRWDFDTETFQPALSTSWNVSDDGMGISFAIRTGAVWHDGVPVTAEDVKFTLDYIKFKSPQWIRETYGRAIESAEVRNEREVIVKFVARIPRDLALGLFSDTWIIPRHLFDTRFFPTTNADGNDFSKMPVGTGAYKVRRNNIDGTITFDVNETYWGDPARVLEIRMMHTPDPVTMVQSALFGSTQLVIETPPNDILQLEQSGQFDLRVYESFTIHVFGYNCQRPILSNPTVRRAMSLAVDRDRLLNQWYNANGSTIEGPFVPASPYFNPDLKKLEYDPELARRLLDRAGLTDKNGDGIRDDESGESISFDLLVPVENVATSTVNQNVAESYVNFMKEIGVEVKAVNKVVDDYIRARDYDRDFDIVWTKWTFGTSYDITDLFHSDSIYPGGNNFIQYDNKQVDGLLDLFGTARDPDERRGYMNTLQKILQLDSPYTFLYTVENHAAISRRFVNTRVDPYYFFTYFKDWYIPEELQE